MKAMLKKIRAGLYIVLGCKCACGGEIRTERVSRGDFTWETFCTKCKTCDPDGHPNLDSVLRHKAYWGGPARLESKNAEVSK